MANKSVLFALFLILSSFVYAQQKVVVLQTDKNDVRIDSRKPTIYITFEHLDDSDFVWLRLHNNSRWSISFRTDESFHGLIDKSSTWSAGRDEFGLLDGAKITPKYRIDRLPIETSVNNYDCTSSQSWLSSGRSVIFKLPRKYLTEIYKLNIMFTYEWESEGFEPMHLVTFDERLPADKTNF